MVDLLDPGQVKSEKYGYYNLLRATSELNRRLSRSLIRFQAAVIVLNNRNRLEPNGTAYQPVVGVNMLQVKHN